MSFYPPFGLAPGCVVLDTAALFVSRLASERAAARRFQACCFQSFDLTDDEATELAHQIVGHKEALVSAVVLDAKTAVGFDAQSSDLAADNDAITWAIAALH